MIRLNHISIPVRDYTVSKDWYAVNLGLRIEFEIPERQTVALNDDNEVTLFLYESSAGVQPECTLTFEVDDVEAKYSELYDKGIEFEKSPQKLFWGYGAELRDPDGYLIYLWDERSMSEKGGV